MDELKKVAETYAIYRDLNIAVVWGSEVNSITAEIILSLKTSGL